MFNSWKEKERALKCCLKIIITNVIRHKGDMKLIRFVGEDDKDEDDDGDDE